MKKLPILRSGCLLVCLLMAGTALGCWLAFPSAAEPPVRVGASAGQAILLPCLVSCCFVLLIRLVSFARHCLYWLGALMFLRGCLFGYWFFCAVCRGDEAGCLWGILLSLPVLNAAFFALAPTSAVKGSFSGSAPTE